MDAKTFILIVVFVLIICILLTGTAYSYSKFRETESLNQQYRIEYDRATERITSLEADNSRLNNYLRSASGYVSRLETLSNSAITDTREASNLIKTIIIQIQSLNNELDNWRSSSYSNNGANNIDDN